MSFFNLLQTVGGRLGILESSRGTAAGGCAKIVTRTVTLEELKTQIRSEEVRILADAPAELAVPFEKIFETAGVPAAAPGWNVARLRDFLQTDPHKNQERGTLQKAVLDALHADQVSPEDLVREAMAQDQALDAYEAFVCRKVEDQTVRAQHQIAGLESRIQALQAERAHLADRIRQDQEKLRAWRRSKRTYERELAGAIGYLTDRPVISTDNDV